MSIIERERERERERDVLPYTNSILCINTLHNYVQCISKGF